MLKSGLLPAPLIQPQTYETLGTRVIIDLDTYIEIKCSVPDTRIYFTTDGTKPDPFQRGKSSTIKYMGAFRLKLGNRILKAIAVTRDKLRESSVTTKYLNVVRNSRNEEHMIHHVYQYEPKSCYESQTPSSSDEEDSYNPYEEKMRPYEMQGAIEGPINPTNYRGTQINIWGLPSGDLGTLAELTRPKPYQQPISEMPRLEEPQAKPQDYTIKRRPEHFEAFCTQLFKLYELNKMFQDDIDTIVELSMFKDANLKETNKKFLLQLEWTKYEPSNKTKNELFQEEEIIKSKPKPSTQPKPQKPMEKSSIDVPEKKPPPLEIINDVERAQPTLVPAINFDADRDCETLKHAFKGLGTKEDVLIKILGNRSNEQRQSIKNMFKTMFGRDLVDVLKSETSGNFKKVLCNLLLNLIEYDCIELKKATQGLGTSDGTLIEILTSRSNEALREIGTLYEKMFKTKLEDDLSSDTSGNYRKLLLSLVSNHKPTKTEVDVDKVKRDVDELIAAGLKKIGTDESKFHLIFSMRSTAHLRALFEEFKLRTGKTIEQCIKSEMSGNLSKTYLAVIETIQNKSAYFATQLHASIKGVGTDERKLNRIIISRCEIDMINIKKQYLKLFKTTLEKDISEDTSGDYRRLLLELIKDPSERVCESTASNELHVTETIEAPIVKKTPTLKPYTNFNANTDCERLRKAMSGAGTDEKTIISILCNRSLEQRLEIKNRYQQMFGKSLIKDLEGELSGDFKKLTLGLFKTQAEFDAWCFEKAIKGIGTDEASLIELLTTRSNEQLNAAKEAYEQEYKKSLENEIKSDTSGNLRKILLSLVNANRPSGNTINRTKAKEDAQALINAGIKKLGTDESRFNVILCSRSYAQLRVTFEEYKKLSGKSLSDDIRSEFSGDIKNALLAIIDSIEDDQVHFAKMLFKAMKGLGTNDNCIVRIILSRCEVDMVEIKEKFEKLYKKSLRDFIKDDLSGDFMRAIMTLIGETPSDISDKQQKNEIQNTEAQKKPHVVETVDEQVYESTPTLKPVENFNPNNDCELLRKAMKGLGTDEKTITEIICHRSLEQRLELKDVYQRMFGKNLVKELQSEISGNFGKVILGLMKSEAEFDAWCFEKAIKGIGTDEASLIELLTTRSNEQLNAAKEAYEQEYKKSLENEIKSDTSGNLRKILLSLVNANRPSGNTIDRTQAEEDAQALINAGIKKLGTDESRFNVILCSRSYAQLRVTFEEYKKLSGKSLSDDIRSEFSGDIKNALLAIIESVQNVQAHFAKMLYKAMKGVGTNESCIIRIIVSRCEKDMHQIKTTFQELYKVSLRDYFKDDLSGDFLKSILALIGE